MDTKMDKNSQFSHHPRSVFGPVNAPSNVAPGQELPHQNFLIPSSTLTTLPQVPSNFNAAPGMPIVPSVLPHVPIFNQAHLPAPQIIPQLHLPVLPGTGTVQQLIEDDMHKTSLKEMDFEQQIALMAHLLCGAPLSSHHQEAVQFLLKQSSPPTQSNNASYAPTPILPLATNTPFLHHISSNIPTTSTAAPTPLTFSPQIQNLDIANFPSISSTPSTAHMFSPVPGSIASPVFDFPQMNRAFLSNNIPSTPVPTLTSYAHLRNIQDTEMFNGITHQHLSSSVASTSTALPASLSLQPAIQQITNPQFLNETILSNITSSTLNIPTSAVPFQAQIQNIATQPVNSHQLNKSSSIASGIPNRIYRKAATPTPSPPSQSKRTPLQTTNLFSSFVNIPQGNTFQEVDPHLSIETLLPHNMPSTSTASQAVTLQPRIQNTLNSPPVNVIQTTNSARIVLGTSNRSPNLSLAPTTASSVSIKASPAVSNKKVPKRAQKKPYTGKENQEGMPKRKPGRPLGSRNGQGVHHDRDKARRQKNKEKQLLEKQKLASAQHHPAPSTSSSASSSVSTPGSSSTPSPTPSEKEDIKLLLGIKRPSSSSREQKEDVNKKPCPFGIWITSLQSPLLNTNRNEGEGRNASQRAQEGLATGSQEPMEEESNTEGLTEEEKQRKINSEFRWKDYRRPYILDLQVFQQREDIRARVSIKENPNALAGYFDEGPVQEIFHSVVNLLKVFELQRFHYKCLLDDHLHYSQLLGEHLERLRTSLLLWSCPSLAGLNGLLAACAVECRPDVFHVKDDYRYKTLPTTVKNGKLVLDDNALKARAAGKHRSGCNEEKETVADEEILEEQEEEQFNEESSNSSVVTSTPSEAEEEEAGEDEELRKQQEEEELRRKQEEEEAERREMQKKEEERFIEICQKRSSFVKLTIFDMFTGEVLLQNSAGRLYMKGNREQCIGTAAMYLTDTRYDYFIYECKPTLTLRDAMDVKKAVVEGNLPVRVKNLIWYRCTNEDGMNKMLEIWNFEQAPQVYLVKEGEVWQMPTRRRNFSDQAEIVKNKMEKVRHLMGDIALMEEEAEPSRAPEPEEAREVIGAEVQEAVGVLIPRNDQEMIDEDDEDNKSWDSRSSTSIVTQKMDQVDFEDEEEAEVLDEDQDADDILIPPSGQKLLQQAIDDEEEEDESVQCLVQNDSVGASESISFGFERASLEEMPTETASNDSSTDAKIEAIYQSAALCADLFVKQEGSVYAPGEVIKEEQSPSLAGEGEAMDHFEIELGAVSDPSESGQSESSAKMDIKEEEEESDFSSDNEEHGAIDDGIHKDGASQMETEEEDQLPKSYDLIRIGANYEQPEDLHFIQIFEKGVLIVDKLAKREEAAHLLANYCKKAEFDEFEFSNDEDEEDLSKTIKMIQSAVKSEIGAMAVKKFTYDCDTNTREEHVMDLLELVKSDSLETIIIGENCRFPLTSQFKGLRNGKAFPQLQTLVVKCQLPRLPISQYSEFHHLELYSEATNTTEITGLLEKFNKNCAVAASSSTVPFFDLTFQTSIMISFSAHIKKICKNHLEVDSTSFFEYKQTKSRSLVFKFNSHRITGKILDPSVVKGKVLSSFFD